MTNDDVELDTGALSRALWSKLPLILSLAVLVGAVTYAALMTLEPLYTADARVLFERQDSPLTEYVSAREGSLGDITEMTMKTQVQILRSRELAARTIEKLSLDRNPMFDPATRPSAIRSLLAQIGLAEGAVDRTIDMRILEAFQERLDVSAVKDTQVLDVSFTALDPDLAAEVANTAAETYVELQQGTLRAGDRAATDWLQDEIRRLRERVFEAETAVETYRAQTDLFGGEAGNSLSQEQLSQLNADLASARASASQAQVKAELVREILAGGGSIEGSQDVLNSALVQRLREREVALRSELAEQSTTLLPNHPRVRRLQRQLADLRAEIAAEVRKILSSLETSARLAKARQQSLEASIEEAKRGVSVSNESGIELRALEREAKAQRDLLEAFLTRYREASARTEGNFAPASARIISRAYAPTEPSFPKKVPLTALAVLATAILVGFLIVLREMTSQRAFNSTSRAGASPAPAPLPARIAAPTPRHVPEVEAISALAALIADAGAQTVLVVNAGRGGGAGDLALALTRELAATSSVVLADMGCGISLPIDDDEPGLGELLAGSSSFDEVIGKDSESEAHFIGAGRFGSDTPPQRFSLIGSALAHSYEHVLFLAEDLDAWAADHLPVDLVALACEQGLAPLEAQKAFDKALERGAPSAVIVRRADERRRAA